jgi:predicted anti-sigma-YlaC factor YlaD
MAAHPETAIVPYLRGELTGDEFANVELHLAGCARCREFADSSGLVMRAIAREAERIPEPDWAVYRAELRRKLAARQDDRARKWRPFAAWVPVAMAGVAAGALVLSLVMRPPVHRGPALDQLAMQDAMQGAMSGADLGLLRDYPVVENLDLLEDYDAIENLDRIAPPPAPPTSPTSNGATRT